MVARKEPISFIVLGLPNDAGERRVGQADQRWPQTATVAAYEIHTVFSVTTRYYFRS